MNSSSRVSRQGANPQANGTTRFEVWAPRASQVVLEQIEIQNDRERLIQTHPLAAVGEGLFAGEIAGVGPGDLYRYSLDGGPGRPDPRSRFQPRGVHGPSQVVDPAAYRWQDQNYRGVAKRDLVIYEMHVGSLTRQGTYTAAIDQLDRLRELGITAIELLPLAQSPGRWNWGYDGVNFFAPRNTFGTPEELKALVDACHARGIAVILDVVYNHVGPEGNYLAEFGPYRSPRRQTPWGDAFNFDGPGAGPVRQYVIDNLLFWLEEYHFDGVRLDAVHYMFDQSQPPILDAIRDAFQQYAAGVDRQLYLIGEANIYDAHLVGRPWQDEAHHDALWSDCLMHSIYAVGIPELRLTNREYGAQDLPEALEHAYLFSTPDAVRVDEARRRQHHEAGERRYVESLITALQTHDSVGNHPHGQRLHQLTSVAFQCAAAPLILLYPSIPMIFMGEEMASESPFAFFADFEDPGLRAAVDRGRRDEYPHHAWADSPLPSDPRAFHDSCLEAASAHAEVTDWYRQLLRLRRRGLDAGWLDVRYLETSGDPDRHVYRLTYRTPMAEVVVMARLDGREAAPLAIEPPPGLACWLNSLDSRQLSPAVLEPQQALIWGALHED